MKKFITSILGICLILAISYGYNQPKNIEEITIGNQTWMKKNLNTAQFQNGDPIPQAKSKEEWIKAGEGEKPAWCYYENDEKNGEKYGKLYNWYAVNDPRGIAPKGWHIPSNEEWSTLTGYWGGDMEAGPKMKSINEWKNNSTEKSHFYGSPGGYRTFGTFIRKGKSAIWWSSSELTNPQAHARELAETDDRLIRVIANKPSGFSVRCIKN